MTHSFVKAAQEEQTLLTCKIELLGALISATQTWSGDGKRLTQRYADYIERTCPGVQVDYRHGFSKAHRRIDFWGPGVPEKHCLNESVWLDRGHKRAFDDLLRDFESQQAFFLAQKERLSLEIEMVAKLESVESHIADYLKTVTANREGLAKAVNGREDFPYCYSMLARKHFPLATGDKTVHFNQRN
jgi:hypothetical protein